MENCGCLAGLIQSLTPKTEQVRQPDGSTQQRLVFPGADPLAWETVLQRTPGGALTTVGWRPVRGDLNPGDPLLVSGGMTGGTQTSGGAAFEAFARSTFLPLFLTTEFTGLVPAPMMEHLNRYSAFPTGCVLGWWVEGGYFYWVDVITATQGRLLRVELDPVSGKALPEVVALHTFGRSPVTNGGANRWVGVPDPTGITVTQRLVTGSNSDGFGYWDFDHVVYRVTSAGWQEVARRADHDNATPYSARVRVEYGRSGDVNGLAPSIRAYAATPVEVLSVESQGGQHRARLGAPIPAGFRIPSASGVDLQLNGMSVLSAQRQTLWLAQPVTPGTHTLRHLSILAPVNNTYSLQETQVLNNRGNWTQLPRVMPREMEFTAVGVPEVMSPADEPFPVPPEGLTFNYAGPWRYAQLLLATEDGVSGTATTATTAEGYTIGLLTRNTKDGTTANDGPAPRLISWPAASNTPTVTNTGITRVLATGLPAQIHGATLIVFS